MARQLLLILDHDLDNVQSLAMFFESQLPHVEAITATSTTAGLQTLRERDVAIVIADYPLRPENGVEFLTQVRELRPRAKTILLTAYSEPSVFTGAVNRAKVDGLFMKPLEPRALLDAVTNMLQAPGDEPPRTAWRTLFNRRDS